MNNNIDISKRTEGKWNNGELGFSVKDDKGSIIAECDYSFRNPYECEANAAFIVKACNNYDKLIEGLKYAIRTLKKTPYTGTANDLQQLLESIE